MLIGEREIEIEYLIEGLPVGHAICAQARGMYHLHLNLWDGEHIAYQGTNLVHLIGMIQKEKNVIITKLLWV